METNLDSVFGRLVVERNLCTNDELQKCVEAQRAKAQQVSGGTRAVALADVLVEKGYVTRSQIDRIRKSAEDYRPATHQIPGFQIQKKLGAGAMAVVYKAKQISLDRIVAVKVLPKRLSENPEYVERFYKEGRAAAKLNHNNIVQAIDVGESGGVHYFVMEYVEGKTVYDDIAKGMAYSEKEALDIITQIADALQHAHERGLIHRDVKPKNIMITNSGVAKLADMGLARELTDQKAAESEQGRAYGTPYYIAPEQIRGELDIDPRADIYSLGATFYHMITGRVPFDGPTPSAVMHKHLKDPLIPPDHLNPSLSVGVAEVIEVMMAKKRTDRYGNAKLLLEDLRAVRQGEPPMLAHQMFDSNVLADLSHGQSSVPSEEEIEKEIQRSSSQVGMKIAVVVLSGVLLICMLIIIILLINRP